MTRFARTADGRPLVGDEAGFVPLSAAAPDCASVHDALTRLSVPDPEDSTATRTPADAIRFGRPLDRFGKLWGIGLNYAAHAEDLAASHPEEPASFMRPHTALADPGGPIRLPPTDQTQRVTAEAELAVVVGRTCRDVDVAAAEDVIAGYLPIIDCTAEDVLERNPRFLTRAKSYDGFLVVGPWIRATDDVDDVGEVAVRTVIDGDVAARDRVANMAFSPRELVAFHSRVMTLEPGDIICTGTPGAAEITPGDTVTAEVDGVGDVAADVIGPDEAA